MKYNYGIQSKTLHTAKIIFFFKKENNERHVSCVLKRLFRVNFPG